MVDQLKAFNWLTWYGGKFSTSQKRGVFMDQALELLPGDYWRWFLTAFAPESSDSAFTWETFQSAINSDLANVLGNFVNRITKYGQSKFDAKVPVEGEPGENETWMAKELSVRLPQLIEHYQNMEFRKAAAETRAIWAAGNEYLTKAEPWTKYKTSVEASAVGVRAGLNLAALFGIIAAPIIPNAAKTILDALGVPEDKRRMNFGPGTDFAKLLDTLPRGAAYAPPPVLFAKIEDAQVAEWTVRFGGG
jgi:methionyl-tRNA synthetase